MPSLKAKYAAGFGELVFMLPSGAGLVGAAANERAFDMPLDLDFELIRNGTTPNYRTVHLQRLANPQLPWNPLPTYSDGTANSNYKAGLPVNPYLTVDSSPVDLTTFNGASFLERSELPTKKGQTTYGLTEADFNALQNLNDEPSGIVAGDPEKQLSAPQVMPNDSHHNTGTTPPPGVFKQRMFVKTLERGYHTTNTVPSGAATVSVERVARQLWSNERFDYKEPRAAGNPTGEGGKQTALMAPETGGLGDLRNVMDLQEVKQTLNDMQSRNLMTSTDVAAMTPKDHVCNFVLEHSLGFTNHAMAPLVELGPNPPTPATLEQGIVYVPYPPPVGAVPGLAAPMIDRTLNLNTPTALKSSKYARAATATLPSEIDAIQAIFNSTYPWLAWNNRPYMSAEEILQVPAASSSTLMQTYSTINPFEPAPAAGAPSNNLYANDGQDVYLNASKVLVDVYRSSFPFGHLLNFFATTSQRRDTNSASPTFGKAIPGVGPNFNRILSFVQVPSRFVGTDELLNPDVFASSSTNAIANPADPRYNLQPPFNKVSRQRDPGRVNINTVVSRRIAALGTNPPRIWSEVYDGVMQRSLQTDSAGRAYGDQDLFDSSGNPLQLGQPGPAWRDVQLSRRGYMQLDTAGNTPDQLDSTFKPINPLSPPPNLTPDSFAFGLNQSFPSFFSNPFRSADAGDLVPLTQMLQYGVDASLLRVHPYVRGKTAAGLPNANWGTVGPDARRAGFGTDQMSVRAANGGVPDTDPTRRDSLPLFSELRNDAAVDVTRNPYMMYQPMTRLGNLVTELSHVFAVWVTVGYFEVEKAPDWNTNQNNVQQRFGGDGTGTAANPTPNAASIAARALYDRVYPEGYALAQEVGSDIGNVKRQRGFYIIDRTIPVGFKPGEDLNDDRAIKVRRRIE
jgi:hypothetical protein